MWVVEGETLMTELSPAVRAVLGATGTAGTPLELTARGIASAALRATVDEILPVEYELVDGSHQYEKKNPVREEFLAIVEELENAIV